MFLLLDGIPENVPVIVGIVRFDLLQVDAVFSRIPPASGSDR
jgi:hypothetical protein